MADRKHDAFFREVVKKTFVVQMGATLTVDDANTAFLRAWVKLCEAQSTSQDTVTPVSIPSFSEFAIMLSKTIPCTQKLIVHQEGRKRMYVYRNITLAPNLQEGPHDISKAHLLDEFQPIVMRMLKMHKDWYMKREGDVLTMKNTTSELRILKIQVNPDLTWLVTVNGYSVRSETFRLPYRVTIVSQIGHIITLLSNTDLCTGFPVPQSHTEIHGEDSPMVGHISGVNLCVRAKNCPVLLLQETRSGMCQACAVLEISVNKKMEKNQCILWQHTVHQTKRINEDSGAVKEMNTDNLPAVETNITKCVPQTKHHFARQVDGLHQEFAKRAVPFDIWMDAATENPQTKFTALSLDEIRVLIGAHETFKMTLIEANKEFNAITKLIDKIHGICLYNNVPNATDNPYTTLTYMDIATKWFGVKNFACKRETDLQDALTQQAHKRLWHLFAQQNYTIRSLIETQAEDIATIGTTLSGSLLDQLEKLCEYDQALTQCESNMAKLDTYKQARQGVEILDNSHSELTMEEPSGSRDLSVAFELEKLGLVDLDDVEYVNSDGCTVQGPVNVQPYIPLLETICETCSRRFNDDLLSEDDICMIVNYLWELGHMSGTENDVSRENVPSNNEFDVIQMGGRVHRQETTGKRSLREPECVILYESDSETQRTNRSRDTNDDGCYGTRDKRFCSNTDDISNACSSPQRTWDVRSDDLLVMQQNKQTNTIFVPGTLPMSDALKLAETPSNSFQVFPVRLKEAGKAVFTRKKPS
ncbi:uncharacterized protein [Ptychodera flava]|uniref:uncharacterized protein n=1 Tax=Ptychodera flava TaxID=63121 RepID=UPI00396A9647